HRDRVLLFPTIVRFALLREPRSGYTDLNTAVGSMHRVIPFPLTPLVVGPARRSAVLPLIPPGVSPRPTARGGTHAQGPAHRRTGQARGEVDPHPDPRLSHRTW